MLTILRRIFASPSVRWSVGLLVLVALVALSLIVKRDYFSELAEGDTRYLNVLYNLQFDVPSGYTVEDIARTDAILLYPTSSNPLETARTEEAFIGQGGLEVRSLRYIPGTRVVFELFQVQEFEKKLSDIGKTFTSERAVTKQGFDAFKVFVTEPTEEVHVVINSPVAYWVMGSADTSQVQTVYDTLKTVSPEETAEMKKPVVDFENFLVDIRNNKDGEAYDKLTEALRSEISHEQFKNQVRPFADRLGRSMQLISIRSDGATAYVRYTLEDAEQDVYSFLGGELRTVDGDWLIDSFVIDKDRLGNPSEEIIKRFKKELKKEDLLGGGSSG